MASLSEVLGANSSSTSGSNDQNISFKYLGPIFLATSSRFESTLAKLLELVLEMLARLIMIRDFWEASNGIETWRGLDPEVLCYKRDLLICSLQSGNARCPPGIEDLSPSCDGLLVEGSDGRSE
tara:strand:- start:950 stop:1321 length:372 start_codon:yes stop_codon:yes gene_type:complete